MSLDVVCRYFCPLSRRHFDSRSYRQKPEQELIRPSNGPRLHLGGCMAIAGAVSRFDVAV